MQISDIMARKVVSATPSTTIRDLWTALFTQSINALPVVNEKKHLLGIVTKEDLLSALYPDYKEYVEDFTSASDFKAMEEKIREVAGVKAKDIMCKRVIFTRENTLVMRALSRMIARRVAQLPVLNEKNELVGVVTKGDVFNALFKKQLMRIVPKSKKSTLKVVTTAKKSSSSGKKRGSKVRK